MNLARTIVIFLLAAAPLVCRCEALSDFVKGADLSWVTQMEQDGTVFKWWDGKPRDCFEVMKGHGVRAVRLRVWVDPKEMGGWCDAADTVAKAKRAKAAGMDVMIDFHYSDRWADPGAQDFPAAWRGHDYPTMKCDLAAHTEKVLTQLKDAGVTPKWVQVGNEISHGFLWNVAKDSKGKGIWEKRDGFWRPVFAASMGDLYKNPAQYTGLFAAGYDAVKRVFPSAKVIVHLHDGWDRTLYDRNLGALAANGAKWDMIGMSLYPPCGSENREKAYSQINACMANIRDLGRKWKCETMIVEVGFEQGANGERTEESRRAFAYLMQEAERRTDGLCRGVFYWEPESGPKRYRCGAFTDDGAPTKLMEGFDSSKFVLSKVIGTPTEKEAPRDILVNKPDYVVFVPKQPRDVKKRDPAKRGDTYNDHFQVLVNPMDGSYHAFWTQASKEGYIDQHVAYARSTDGGANWTEPVLIAGSDNQRHPMVCASWQQPMVSRSGRLYCLWCQQVSDRRCAGSMFGAYSDDNGVTWSDPRMVKLPRTDADDPDPTVPAGWIQWQRPLRQGEGGRYFVATSRHGKAPYDPEPMCKIEFWQYDNIDDNPKIEDIKVSYSATNRDALDVSKIAGGPHFKPKHEREALEEASVVKLPDGRLFAVMRSSIGHPVWTQSRDGGRTWSGPKPLRDRDGGTPYLHPRSPCPMYDWKGEEAASGTYFVLVHNTFDFKKDYAYQDRGPLYLIAGRFNPDAKDQPVEFSAPKLFAPRNGNSFYTSYTVRDGRGVLWFNDYKFYLCGREVGPEWFADEKTATVDFTRPVGKRIRALNGGNLGPAISSADVFGPGTNDFAALRVPITRLHDAPGSNFGFRLVDVHAIFGNAKADPADADNYYFRQTDDYIRRIRDCGSEILYRLGTSIEHSNESYFANPPEDFERWADVCLGIVRHYNAGWANGFKWNIRYWEVWNEPDIGKKMWTGTIEDYCRLYGTVARKIKAEFPDVRIGGPAFARFHPEGERNFSEKKAHAFLAYCRDNAVPLDFFSWHRYGCTIEPLLSEPARMRKVLDSYGFVKAELVLDEWHYWPPEGFQKKIAQDPVHGLASVNAAVFAVAAMIGWQDAPLDVSCHYTLGPLGDGWGAWDRTNDRTPLFYTFRAFARMLDYPNRVAVESPDPCLQILAGTDGKGRRGVLIADFKTGADSLSLVLKGAENVRFACVRTDETSLEADGEVVADGNGRLTVAGVPADRSALILLTETQTN